MLAAGKGTRLGALTKQNPKCLMEFMGIPFLELLISKLYREKCTKIIVVVEYLAHKIEEYISSRPLPEGFILKTCRQMGGEGTLPALLSGLSQVRKDRNVLCINADTILDISYDDVVDKHKKETCDITLVTTDKPGVPNYGAIQVTHENRILAFREGQDYDPNIKERNVAKNASNCGCYCLNPKAVLPILQTIEGQSFEKDALPELVKILGAKNYSIGNKTFLDFGTPEQLERIQQNRDLIQKIYL